jgi:hypothetical protein
LTQYKYNTSVRVGYTIKSFKHEIASREINHHVGEDLWAQPPHLVPAQRPAAHTRGIEVLSHRREPEAAHFDWQPRLMHRTRALSSKPAR